MVVPGDTPLAVQLGSAKCTGDIHGSLFMMIGDSRLKSTLWVVTNVSEGARMSVRARIMGKELLQEMREAKCELSCHCHLPKLLNNQCHKVTRASVI